MKFTFRRKIPAVTIFEDFENKEFLDRFNALEGGADPPF